MKDKRTTRYPLRIDEELKSKASYVSDYNGRSLNKQIEQLLKQMVSDFESKHGEIVLEAEENPEQKPPGK